MKYPKMALQVAIAVSVLFMSNLFGSPQAKDYKVGESTSRPVSIGSRTSTIVGSGVGSLTPKDVKQLAGSDDASAFTAVDNSIPMAPQASVTLVIYDVDKIQQALSVAGFDPGPMDGKMGPKTRAAIRDFQRSRGLTPDGIVGRRTAAELDIQ